MVFSWMWLLLDLELREKRAIKLVLLETMEGGLSDDVSFETKLPSRFSREWKGYLFTLPNPSDSYYGV